MNKLSIGLTRLMTKVLGNLVYRTIDMSKKTANEEITTNPLLKKVETTYTLYNEVVIKPLSSGLGNKVIGLDKKRDDIFFGIQAVVDGLARIDGAKGEAAKALQRCFDEVGTIAGEDYASESEVIKKLVKLLSTEALKAHIATLGLTDEVALLEAAQTEFHNVYMQQAQVNAALKQQGSASALRRDMQTTLRAYYSFVWAMKGIAPWTSLYAELAELTKAAKNTIGKTEKEADSELNPEPKTEPQTEPETPAAPNNPEQPQL